MYIIVVFMRLVQINREFNTIGMDLECHIYCNELSRDSIPLSSISSQVVSQLSYIFVNDGFLSRHLFKPYCYCVFLITYQQFESEFGCLLGGCIHFKCNIFVTCNSGLRLRCITQNTHLPHMPHHSIVVCMAYIYILIYRMHMHCIKSTGLGWMVSVVLVAFCT